MIDHDRARELGALVRRPASLFTIAALAVALIAGGLVWNAGRPSAANQAGASQAPATASPDASASPAAGDPWASADPSAGPVPLPGEDAPATAILTAAHSTGSVIPLDADFRLASVDATPASELATHLTVRPPIDLAIKAEAGDRTALLTPSEPLQPGVVYRFALNGAGGQLLDSWAFQARQPLRVVGTIPDNQATDVLINTGIEITFDQDGFAGAEGHISIEPATPGRFEQHGRTVAFVPDQLLSAASIYTVTVSRGVTVPATGEATEADTRFQFETAAKVEPTTPTTTFAFQDQVVESPTGERPVIGLWWFADEDEQPAPKAVAIEVYRLADLAAGIDAFQTLRARPDWSRWSNEGLLDTTKLHRVVSVDARIEAYRDAYFVRLPERLAAGWYLVQQPDGTRPSQTVLQVTDVAGYLAISDTRTLVWANDVNGGGPIEGAAAAADGIAIDTTDSHGLAMGPTPKGLLPQPSQVCTDPCDPVVTVKTADGRAVFLPAAEAQDKLEGYGGMYYWYTADRGYWSLLHTDRNHYRPADTVNLWGVIRGRDDGIVPATVTVRVRNESYDDANVHPAVLTATARPGRTGAFTSSLSLAGVAEGYYTIELVVGDSVVRTTSFLVGPIAKPAYRLEITTGRRVYIRGDRIKVTVNAAFFEGTPVPGVPLRIDGYVARNVTTDAEGSAIYRTIAKLDSEVDLEGPSQTAISVNPARAEEGEIAGASRDFVVFPSSRTVDATSRIANGKVLVSGSVHHVAVDRLEAELDKGHEFWNLDPRGAAIPNVTVTIRFTELIPVRTQRGTEYDFIEKKVVPTYETRIVERAAGTQRVKTTAHGAYKASIPATTKDHDYSVVVTVGDPDGHTAQASSTASRDPWSAYDDMPSAKLAPTHPSADGSDTFGVGDRIDVTMSDPDTRQATGDGTRYLFFMAQRGLRQAIVQSSPRFVTTFKRWAVPNMTIGAVRFTGQGYVGTVAFDAPFRTSDRRVQVDLSTPAARYAPGAKATVDIRTRDASGAPVAATLIVRAVDEKLYAIGAAEADDPLAELYAPVDSGLIGYYVSHRHPHGDSGGGGDTGGGGGDDRDDFRDYLLFASVTTDANGRGSVSFRLSDDLTSWRVTASAITTRLEAGFGSVLVPVGLPFFVDASMAPEYLASDRPSIPVRAFGSAVAVGDAVTIRVTSKSLGFDSGPIRTAAFKTTDVPLPKLHLGLQTITISATTGSGTTARTDRLTRSFTVVDTRLTRTQTTYRELPSAAPFAGGEGWTTVVVSDAGGGRYLALLTDLAEGGGARMDRALAADMASSLLASRFGSPHDETGGGTFVASRYQTSDGGLALLPYASSDLELSALVAIVAPDHIDRGVLENYLRGIRDGAGETRERRMFALAGLAGLGEPVMPAIRSAADDPALTVRERLMIGLGAAALGDAATARTIATSLYGAYGEQLGEQARLRVGASGADITWATAMMAVLGAALGDARAPLFWAYVEDNPAKDQLEVLPAVAYVTNSLDRLAVHTASFTYSVDGTRTKVTLEPSRAFELSLTAAQLATLTIEPTAGAIGVTTSWREAIRPSAVQPDPDVTITRSVKPSTTIGSADLVTVDLTVNFGRQAAAGCHQVTELVPSGLTPVGPSAGWIDPDNEEPTAQAGYDMPYDQSGPRVFFCAEPTAKARTVVLRYYARVVTPGTYTWEPAIAESRSQDGQASLTGAGRIIIR